MFFPAGATLRRIAAPRAIGALATAGSSAWLWSGDRLFALDERGLHPTETRGAGELIGSPTGAVWQLGGPTIARLSFNRPTDDPAWQTAVAPVFARVCSHCHLPGGDAGIDLSTSAAWRDERAELRHRVLETRTMPAGTVLSDDDRAALAAWLER